MPRLDRLIQVLYEQRADALQLVVGKPAMLLTNGSGRALTKEPLTDAQILTLVREVADPASAQRVGSAEALSFPYRSPSGQVTVALTPGAAGPLVEVRVAGGSPAAPAGRNAAEVAYTFGPGSRRCSGCTGSWCARTGPQSPPSGSS